MSDTLTTELKLSLVWQFQDALDLATVLDNSQLNYHKTLANGTASDQADKIWHDQRTLAAGAHEDLVLSALPRALFDNALTIALAKVKAIMLVNTAIGAGQELVVGGAAADEWIGPFAASGNKLAVPADSCMVLVNKKSGWAVAAGSADQLRIANAGSGSITYDIVILGTSA